MNIQLTEILTQSSNAEDLLKISPVLTDEFSNLLEEEFGKVFTEDLNNTILLEEEFGKVFTEDLNNTISNTLNSTIDSYTSDKEQTGVEYIVNETNQNCNITAHYLMLNTPNVEESLVDIPITLNEDKLNNVSPLSTNKNTKSGTDFADDVKYTLDNTQIFTSDNIESYFIQDNSISSSLEINVDTNNVYNTSNDSGLIDEETIEGEFIYTNTLDSMDNSLEEEVSKLANNEETTSDIMKQLKNGISTSSTPKHIQIILKPRSLGTLNLNIKFINNAMHVDIHVDNGEVQDILSENLLQLERILDPESFLNIETINIIKKQDNIKSSRNIFGKTSLLNKNIASNNFNTPMFLFK